MRTQKTSTRPDHASTAARRLAALGLAAAVAAAVTACGGGGSAKTAAGSTGGTVNGKTTTSQAGPAPTPSAVQTSDPAQGPVQDPATLPKTCNGLVTDADVQLQVGGPLAGGDVYTAYLPVAGIKQTKKVKCQYGEVLDAAGKFQSDQLEVQMATYADADSAKSRGAGTVGDMAAKGGTIKQESVDGHPATLVAEQTDTVLVMFDGNRTFLITIQAVLAQGDKAEKLALSLMSALYKHTLPAGGGSVATAGPTSGGTATPGASGGPVSGSATATPGAPATS